MARLFITQREIDFISDITKEVIKDVIGQKIFYYPVSAVKTDVHEVYDEAVKKVFDNPIELECLVNWMPEEIRTNQFGTEEYFSIEVYVHNRDLLDKGIEVYTGDYFSYGSIFFEITSHVFISNIFGQVEYKTGIKITGKQARKDLIKTAPIGPTTEGELEGDSIQSEFVQQRGEAENKLGKTGDKRALIDKGVLDKPLTGPREVSDAGDSGSGSSSFYDE